MKNLNPKLVRRFMGILIVVTFIFMVLQWTTDDNLAVEVLHNLSAAMLAITAGWLWGYGNAARDVRKALFDDFIAIKSRNNLARREAQMMYDPDLRN